MPHHLPGVVRLDVRIGARCALEDAPRAHEDLSARRTTGKSLVVPTGA